MMKYLALSIMLLALSQTNAQPELLMLMDDDAGFDPLTFDANTVALYDGDKELTTSSWVDQAGTYDLTLSNTPTIVTGAVNGHNAIQFNGTNEDGSNTDITVDQPFTVYLVFKQITWGDGDRILGMSGSDLGITQFSVTPNLVFYFGGLGLNTDPDLATDTYGIITCVINNASSEVRTNDNVASTGTAGVSGYGGIRLASQQSSSNFANIEVAYLIIRSGVDDTATQDLFITFLISRFGL